MEVCAGSRRVLQLYIEAPSCSFKLDFHLTFNPFVSAWPVAGASFLGVLCVCVLSFLFFFIFNFKREQSCPRTLGPEFTSVSILLIR